MDYTVYPDGFEALKKELNFLPEDDSVRTAYLQGLIAVVVNY